MAIVQVGYGMAKFAFPSLHHAFLRLTHEFRLHCTTRKRHDPPLGNCPPSLAFDRFRALNSATFGEAVGSNEVPLRLISLTKKYVRR